MDAFVPDDVRHQTLLDDVARADIMSDEIVFFRHVSSKRYPVS